MTQINNGSTYEVFRTSLNEINSAVVTTVKKTVSSIATAGLFTVAGGPVEIISIIGHITTGIQASANDTKLQHTPTGGAAVDLCAVLDVTGATIRKLLSITGVKADAMVLSADEGVSIEDANQKAIRVTPGVISMNCAGTTTGVIDWYIKYEPLDSDAVIT